MDYFEALIKTLLESEGYWVRQSFKVNLSKQEKRNIGKHSIPRPEIDIVAYKPSEDILIAYEAKSYLDNPGVRVADLEQSFEVPEGRYKLFTCDNYRNIVFDRLKSDLLELGMATPNTNIVLGLAVGNIYQSKINEMAALMNKKGFYFLSPADIRLKVSELANKAYENEPSILTAKILLRDYR